MIDIITGTDGAERLTGKESRTGGRIALAVLILLVAGAAVGGGYWYRIHHKPVVVDLKAEAQAVKDADTLWSKAAQTHDKVTVTSYYADDATVLPANSELLTNKPAVQKYWMDHLTPDVDVSWTPMYVEVAKSGDVAYVVGSYSMTTHPAKGKKGAAVTDRGKYLSVWKKQDDGSWKAEANTWNSDQPVPGKKG